MPGLAIRWVRAAYETEEEGVNLPNEPLRDIVETETPKALHGPPAAFREPRRLLSFTPFKSSTGEF